MTEKKAPALTGATNERNSETFNSQLRHYTGKGKKCKVEFYPEGMRLIAPSSGFKGLPDHLKHVTRGEVKGWSPASRKGMRNWMLTHEVMPGHDLFAVTLTVPGPPLAKEEWEKLWHTFSVYLRRMKGAAVWRKEVQSRDAVHWHCIVALPYFRSDIRNAAALVTHSPGDPNGKTLSERLPKNHGESYVDLYSDVHTPKGFNQRHFQHQEVSELLKSGLWRSVVDLYRLWFRCLDTLGEVSHKGGNGVLQEVSSRSFLRGASVRAIEISHMSEEKKGWNRYMLDHTTKAKQQQIADHKGRHWGTINKKLFVEIEPSSTNEMTWKQYSRFLRFYNRLITPYVRCDGAMFGKVKGRSFRRGMYGKYVTFTNPETGRRMAEMALAVPDGLYTTQSKKKQEAAL